MSKDRETDFVTKKGKSFHYIEVKYRQNIAASDIKLPPALKNKTVTIVSRDTYEKTHNLTLIPLPLFLAFPQDYLDSPE